MNRILIVYEGTKEVGRNSNAETIDFAGVRIGASTIAITESGSVPGALDFHGAPLKNIGAPVDAGDVATKAFVLSNAGGSPTYFNTGGASVQGLTADQLYVTTGNNNILTGLNLAPIANYNNFDKVTFFNDNTGNPVTIFQTDGTTAITVVPAGGGVQVIISDHTVEGSYRVETIRRSRSDIDLSAVDQDIFPSTFGTLHVGSITKPWMEMWSGSFMAVDGGGVKRAELTTGVTSPGGGTTVASLAFSGTASVFSIFSENDGTADGNNTGQIRIETGNKTAGAGDSGDIVLLTGTSSGGTRGGITLNASKVDFNQSPLTNVNSIKGGSGGLLIDVSGVNSVDWQDRQLLDNTGVLSLQWVSRGLYDPAGNAVAGWGDIGTFNMLSHRITNLATPTLSTDAVPRSYVDALFTTGALAKANVKVATAAAFNSAAYSNGTSGVGATLTNTSGLTNLQVDGYSVSLGDRVLVKDQAASLQNGIYTVTTVGDGATAWVLTRATDFDGSSPNGVVDSGDTTYVLNGSQAGSSWTVISPNPAVIGTDSITMTQTGAPAANQQLSNLNGPTSIGVDLLPSSDEAHALGSPTHRWNSLNAGFAVLDYIQLGSGFAAGAGGQYSLTLSGQNVLPSVDGGIALGNGSFRYSQVAALNGFFDGMYDTLSQQVFDFTGGVAKVIGGLNLNNLTINNLADPVGLQDAATKAFVLANSGGGNGGYLFSNSSATTSLNPTVDQKFIHVIAGTGPFSINLPPLTGYNLYDKVTIVNDTSLTLTVNVPAGGGFTVGPFQVVEFVVTQNGGTIGTTNYDHVIIRNDGSVSASRALDNLSSVAINTDLLPDSDANRNLGGVGFRWNMALIGTVALDTISLGSSGATTSLSLSGSTITPNSNYGINLGDSTLRFGSVYANVFAMNALYAGDGATQLVSTPGGTGWQFHVAPDLDGLQINNLASPTSPQDAANMGYVDTVAAGFLTFVNANAGAIVAGNLTYLKPDGTMDLADQTTAGLSDALIAVVSNSSIAAAASGNFYATPGVQVSGFSGLTPGKMYYVGTAGALTDTPSGASGSSVYEVGRAISATAIMYNPRFVLSFA